MNHSLVPIPRPATNPLIEDVDDQLAQRRERASVVIQEFVALSIGAGFLMTPLIDAAAIMAFEVQMISDLARVYDFPLPRKLVAYKLLISLAGSVGPIFFSSHVKDSFSNIPGIGYLLSAGMLSLTGGVSVYAVGKIFQKHYESGGTFLGGDPEAIKQSFRESRNEGKRVIRSYAF